MRNLKHFPGALVLLLLVSLLAACGANQAQTSTRPLPTVRSTSTPAALPTPWPSTGDPLQVVTAVDNGMIFTGLIVAGGDYSSLPFSALRASDGHVLWRHLLQGE